MSPFLTQIKNRRIALGLKQHDMQLRVGMSRQQYQRLESRGNPRLATLELIAAGLGSEIMLVPREKLAAVQAALESGEKPMTKADTPSSGDNRQSLVDDPWQDLLMDDDNG